MGYLVHFLYFFLEANKARDFRTVHERTIRIVYFNFIELLRRKLILILYCWRFLTSCIKPRTVSQFQMKRIVLHPPKMKNTRKKGQNYSFLLLYQLSQMSSISHTMSLGHLWMWTYFLWLIVVIFTCAFSWNIICI